MITKMLELILYSANIKIITIKQQIRRARYRDKHSTGWLHAGLLVPLGVNNLDPTHGTDTLLICTGLAVVGPDLVHLLLADTALLELSGHGVEPVLLVCQELVLPDLPPPRYSCVTCPSFPRVRCDNL